ncbi:MAG: hypothetical protein A4E57_02223 [Syntrophorhabdaceae bacterium PtaU1.Bin034]|nr:MAG: hypothetical protein A4E57_02223 [Syntrophorhabdaceae bacterium PtaU1.Bin034]
MVGRLRLSGLFLGAAVEEAGFGNAVRGVYKKERRSKTMCDKGISMFISSTGSCGDSPLRFWEIETYFKCPVVGLCLTSSEQQKILKKAGVPLKERSLFEMHEILVSSGETENGLSRKIDQFLRLKFGVELLSLYAMREEAFMQRWRSDFDSGEQAAVLWAGVTRPNLSQEARWEIFGAIHMSMHGNAEARARDRRLLKHLQDETTQQARKLKEMTLARRDLQKENDDMARLLSGIKAELLAARKENEQLRNEVDLLKNEGRIAEFEAENRLLRGEIAEKTLQISSRDRLLDDLKKRSADLSVELENQVQENAQFRQEAQEVLHEFIEMSRCNITCPVFDLCRKRVLIVGGITRMEALYRRLIEESGGVFEYHDGYVHGGTKQLENSLKRADIVLCPVNCNSHAACSLVKNLGKKHNKPVHMLASFSLSTVSHVLARNGRDERYRGEPVQ